MCLPISVSVCLSVLLSAYYVCLSTCMLVFIYTGLLVCTPMYTGQSSEYACENVLHVLSCLSPLIYVSSYLSLFICLFVSVSLYLSLCICFFVSVPVYLFLCICLFVSVPFYLSLCICVFVSVSLYLCLCIFLFLYF